MMEERSSDDPFQVSNLKFHGGSTCGQQALTKVTKIMKKRYLKASQAKAFFAEND